LRKRGELTVFLTRPPIARVTTRTGTGVATYCVSAHCNRVTVIQVTVRALIDVWENKQEQV